MLKWKRTSHNVYKASHTPRNHGRHALTYAFSIRRSRPGKWTVRVRGENVTGTLAHCKMRCELATPPENSWAGHLRAPFAFGGFG